MNRNIYYTFIWFFSIFFIFINCSVSIQKCLEYSELFKSDPIEDNILIVDEPSPIGKLAAIRGEFPHMVTLGYKYDKEITFRTCGGVLITEKYVLTTAICAKYEPKIIRLGANNIKFPEESVQDLVIKNIIIHPLFDEELLNNDISLLELSNSVKFNRFLRPACLNNFDNLPPGTDEFIVTGWGRLAGNALDLPDTLHKVYVELFTNEECNFYYANRTIKLQFGINGTMICAGGKNKPRGVCQGDAGGPLQYYDKNYKIYQIIGLVSFGSPNCGEIGMPTVYTKVSAFVPWIESIVWNAE